MWPLCDRYVTSIFISTIKNRTRTEQHTARLKVVSIQQMRRYLDGDWRDRIEQIGSWQHADGWINVSDLGIGRWLMHAVEEVGWWIWCDEDSDQLLSVHWFGRWRRCWVPTSYYGMERASWLSVMSSGTRICTKDLSSSCAAIYCFDSEYSEQARQNIMLLE